MEVAPTQPRRRPRSVTRLSAADAAWLRMDRPANPMMICAAMFTERPLALPALRGLLTERLLSPRFRQPLSRRGELRRPFEIEAHVHRCPGGDPPNAEALFERISGLMLRPLPRSRPLWDVNLVEHWGPGSVLVWRVHHAVGDGLALLRVLLSAADQRDPQGLAPPVHPGPRWRDVPRGLASLARVVFLPADSQSPVKRPLAGRREIAWSEPVSVEEIKAIGSRQHATVNEVLTCALAGALHRSLLARGISPPRSVRAIVPFDLRAGQTDERLGNEFGLLFLSLPLGALTFAQRLRKVKRESARIKTSPEGVVTFLLLRLIGLLSPGLATLAIRFFSRKASVVLSNLAGPRHRLALGGAVISDFIFWVPQTHRIGLGLSILSYAGKVRIGVNADVACLPSPQALAQDFVSELRSASQGRASGFDRRLRRRTQELSP